MKYVLIGKIVKPQGLSGEIKVKLFDTEPEAFLVLKTLRIEGEEKQREILSLAVRQNFLYVKLEGIDSIEKAKMFREKLVYASDDEIRDGVGLDEILVDDILGFDVVLNNNENIGKLVDVQNFGSADVYFVKNDKNSILFSNIPGVIAEIDVDEKKIVLNKEKFDEVSLYEN